MGLDGLESLRVDLEGLEVEQPIVWVFGVYEWVDFCICKGEDGDVLGSIWVDIMSET